MTDEVIGFYASHYGGGGLNDTAATFEEEGIPFEKGNCLCQNVDRSDRYVKGDALPPRAVVHADYGSFACQSGLNRIIEANQERYFYVAFFTENVQGIETAVSRIGHHNNVTFLCLDRVDAKGTMPFEETMQRVLEALKQG